MNMPESKKRICKNELEHKLIGDYYILLLKLLEVSRFIDMLMIKFIVVKQSMGG